MFKELAPEDYLPYGLFCKDCGLELMPYEIEKGSCVMCEDFKLPSFISMVIKACLDREILRLKRILKTVRGEEAHFLYKSAMNAVGGQEISVFASIERKKELIEELKYLCQKKKT